MNRYLLSPLAMLLNLAIVLASFVSCSSEDEIEPTGINGKWISTMQVYETWIDGTKTYTETIPNDQDNYIRITFHPNGTFDNESMDSGTFKEGEGDYEITNDTLTVTGTINTESFTQKHKLDFNGENGMKMTSQTTDIMSGDREVIHKAIIDYMRE
jgi:hypothetical protein